MSEKTNIDLNCPKCGELTECLWIMGYSSTTREKGSTGHSHFVTRKTGDQIIGECKCGYKFKPKDLEA